MEISKETLFKVVSFLTNDKVNQQELIDYISEDLESEEQLFNAIKPTLIEYKKESRKELIGKGFRQAAKKTENLLKEVYPNVELEGTQEDMFIQLRDTLKKPVKEVKEPNLNLTWEEALKYEPVRNKVQELQNKASKVDELENKHESFKRYVGIKDLSIGFLKEAGAQLNPQSKLYNLQMQAIEQQLSSIKTKKVGDQLYIVDEEGDVKINPETAKEMTLKDFVINNSPVDFVEQQPAKQDKKIYTPSGDSKGTVNPYNYAKDHKFTYSEHKEALKNGEPQKAEFIKSKMIEQAGL
jgi:hypothetical protein